MYVFQHKKITGRIKMVEAFNFIDAKEKLASRLKNGHSMNSRIEYDLVEDYLCSFKI